MAPLVDRTLIVADLLAAYPAATPAFAVRGMACVGCPMARFETLEEVAAAYAVDLDAFLGEIKNLAAGHIDRAARPLRKRKDTRGRSQYR